MKQNMSQLQKLHYVSKIGLAKLQQKLAALQKEYGAVRRKLAEMGPLGLTDEYDIVDSRMQLAFLTKEISRLQTVLRACKVLGKLPQLNTVQLGAQVVLQDGTDREIRCMLVSPLEADPSEGRISIQSPLGSALLGKMVNTFIRVTAPHKSFSYRIKDINYST